MPTSRQPRKSFQSNRASRNSGLAVGSTIVAQSSRRQLRIRRIRYDRGAIGDYRNDKSAWHDSTGFAPKQSCLAAPRCGRPPLDGGTIVAFDKLPPRIENAHGSALQISASAYRAS
jgi:hypothetical protein